MATPVFDDDAGGGRKGAAAGGGEGAVVAVPTVPTEVTLTPRLLVVRKALAAAGVDTWLVRPFCTVAAAAALAAWIATRMVTEPAVMVSVT